jgi:hypothetical protein
VPTRKKGENMLYTAQYRYPGQDRLDITVKGNCPAGKIYAPTWEMVRGLKAGTLSEEEYTGQYYNILIDRWQRAGSEMLNLVDMVRDRDLTVVCFCPPGAFCHRHLLVKFLQHNWAAEYGGERTGF